MNASLSPPWSILLQYNIPQSCNTNIFSTYFVYVVGLWDKLTECNSWDRERDIFTQCTCVFWLWDTLTECNLWDRELGFVLLSVHIVGLWDTLNKCISWDREL